MAAGAEVFGEKAVIEVPAVEPSSPKATDTTTQNADSNSNYNNDISAPSSDGAKETDSSSNISNEKSELEIEEIDDMLKTLKLNPLAKEFFPSSYNRDQLGLNNFVPPNKIWGNDSFPNIRRV